MAENLEFSVKDPQGNDHTFTDDFLMQSMKQAGQPIVGVTEDGSSVMLPPPKPGGQPIEKPWADVLAQRGFTVTGVKPVNADHDNVQLGWTAAMDSLTDDQEKRDYLGVKMRGLGHQNTKIVGQGNDWYAFNPASSQWVAITNKPGLDATDFARVGLAAPRFLGSVVGGAAGAALGAPTGPGAVASTAVGAGLGGGAGETLKRGVTALIDPDYKQVAGANLGNQAKDIGIGSAWDAATMGAGRAIGPALKALSPLATTARAGGAAAEGAGALAAKAGGAVAKSPMAGDLIAQFAPGIGPVNSLGWMARLPRDAIRGIPAAMEWAGGKLNGIAPDLARKMVGAGRQLGRGAEESISQQGANWISRGLHGTPEKLAANAPAAARRAMQTQPTASSVMRNIGRAADVARGRGSEEGVGFGIRNASGSAGKVIDALGAAGQGLTTTTANLVRGAAGATGGLGRGLQAAGSTARRLGTLGQPMEGLAYARSGTDALDKWIREKLRQKQHRATMLPETYLASMEY